METQKLREAILEKAKEEANKIVSDAGARAEEIIDKARKKASQQREELKTRILNEARREAAKITAQSSLKARQIILNQKDSTFRRITDEARSILSERQSDKNLVEKLIIETLDAYNTKDKVNVCVNARDLEITRKLVTENKRFKNQIYEVQQGDFLGGVMIVTVNGKVRFDNTFDRRMNMLLPKIIPEIVPKLFGDNAN